MSGPRQRGNDQGGATEFDIASEAMRLVGAAREQGIEMRLFGGLAIRAHTEGWTPPGPARIYADIDVVIGRGMRSKVGPLFERRGYRGKEPFNSLNPTRLVFYDSGHARHVDVFVEEFEMCHRIAFAKRLGVDPLTVPIAELLLSKLQIVQLNVKDISDIVSLLRSQEVRDADDAGINAQRIAELLAADWGLWRTVTQNLARLPEVVRGLSLQESDSAVVERRVHTLCERIESQPKSVGWRLRSKIGDKRKWYLEPEEIEHEE